MQNLDGMAWIKTENGKFSLFLQDGLLKDSNHLFGFRPLKFFLTKNFIAIKGRIIGICDYFGF